MEILADESCQIKIQTYSTVILKQEAPPPRCKHRDQNLLIIGHALDVVPLFGIFLSR